MIDEPLRIPCSGIDEIPTTASLIEFTRAGRCVVLQFPLALHLEPGVVVGRLAASLPDHSVFQSGRDASFDWISVMPVVARAIVQAHVDEISEAVRRYIGTCESLVSQYTNEQLGAEWECDEHGDDCRFSNRLTGQVVEAPLERSLSPANVDPYFFAAFVKSTAGLERVAALIRHDFHDAARMLEILFANDTS